MSEESRTRFIAALDLVDQELYRMGFQRHTIEKQGFATWVTYTRADVQVQFACAPPKYHIEMFLSIGSVTYELAELMKKHVTEEWMQIKELKTHKGDALSAEAQWHVALLRVALPEM